MRMHPAVPFFLATLVLAVLATEGRGTLVPGRGGSCAAVWDTFEAPVLTPRNTPTLTCEDGDVDCDTDGIANGRCAIRLAACVGMGTDACPAPPPLRSRLRVRARVGGKTVFLNGLVVPDRTDAPGCGTAGVLELPLRTAPDRRFPTRPSRQAHVRLHARGFGNHLVVQCVPQSSCDDFCPFRETGPSILTLIGAPASDDGRGGDLDLGWTGRFHNLRVADGAQLRYCLDECDGTNDTTCRGQGGAGDRCSQNGAIFGAPVPIVASGVAVCVVNRFLREPLTIAYDVATGDGRGDLALSSEVYLSDVVEPCPRCIATRDAPGAHGICSSRARIPGRPCVVGAVTPTERDTHATSSDCLPAADTVTAAFPLRLALTTGTSELPGPTPCADDAGPQPHDDGCSGGTCDATCTGTACVATDAHDRCIDRNGGIAQQCCSNAPSVSCYPTRDGGRLVRTGTPAPVGGAAVFAATFCLPRTGVSLLDSILGLPGPGALLWPAQVVTTP